MRPAPLQARRPASRTQSDEPATSFDPSLGLPSTDITTSSTSPPSHTLSSSTADLPQQCWICYESTLESPDPLLHVCNCTLLAHSTCLLTWLQQRQQSQAASPRCPVCAAPILIVEDQSQALRLYRKVRRLADKVSLAAAVGAVGASGWFIAAAYGAYVVKVFMGEQVARALLSRHDKGLPWRYWLNLPLIPFTLILSRTPLIDSLLPFLPLTLLLSSHSPYSYSSPSHFSFLHSTSFTSSYLEDLTFRYPPSPTLTVCLLPWLRLLYLKLRWRVFRAVLGGGSKKKYRGLAGVFEEAAEDEVAFAVPSQDAETAVGGEGEAERGEGGGGGVPIEMVATIELEIEDIPADPHPQPNQTQNLQQPPPTPTRAAAGDAALPPSARLRIGLGRLTSLLLSALIFPTLSALAGSALFLLASKTRGSKAVPWRVLRKVLGVGAVLAVSGGRGAGGAARGAGGGGGGVGTGLAGWITRLIAPLSSSPSSSTFSGLGLGGVGRPTPLDPVWVRNTFGAGMVLLLRDAVELTAGVLEERRKKSRRVVEKPFRPGSRGESQNEREREREGMEGMSGGRNTMGREARVHNFL
ncbi:hypothetical protein JCM11641_002806 [Rhodosporidiobolus odoratus]